jgi:hypothetical protein
MYRALVNLFQPVPSPARHFAHAAPRISPCRYVHWRADVPATLVWAEANDEGDPLVTPPDQNDAGLCLARRHCHCHCQPGLMMVDAVQYHAGEPVREIVWALPSEGFVAGDTAGARQAVTVARLGLRYGGCQYAADGFMVVREWWYKTRKERAHLVTTRDAVYKYHAVLYDRSSEDRYGNPGDFVMRRHPVYGTLVLWTIPTATPGAARLMLTGAGASPDGDRPFMDVLDLGVADQQVMRRLHATLIHWPLYIVRAWFPRHRCSAQGSRQPTWCPSHGRALRRRRGGCGAAR